MRWKEEQKYSKKVQVVLNRVRAGHTIFTNVY